MRQLLQQKLSDRTNVLPPEQTGFEDSAIEALFEENFPGLCIYCQYKFGFDLDLAKEAVYTGFIKLLECRNNISPDVSINAYLYKITTNVCYDFIKHAKIKLKYEKHMLRNSAISYNKTDCDKVEFNELTHRIDKAVSELPDQMRKIFEMSRYEGLKYSEISAKLNISVKTVETQMSRSLIKLRRQLSAYLPFSLLIILHMP